MADDKKKSSNKVLSVVGPKDEKSKAEAYRFYHDDGRKGYKNLRIGEKLVIGKDITKTEAERLKNDQIWNFEEVNG